MEGRQMSKQKKQWVWKCPIPGCQSKGIRPSTKANARRNGMTHMRASHDIHSGEPIVIELKPQMIVTTSFRKSVWICPVKGCPSHGNMPMKRSQARYHGKKHLQFYHKRNGDPDLLFFTRKTREKTIKKEVRRALREKGIADKDIDVSKIRSWKPKK